MKYELKSRTSGTECPSAEVLEAAAGNMLLAQLLEARGIRTGKDAEAFLHPSASQLLDPFSFRGMKGAADMIRSAVDTGRHICVHGDYDADGTCGAAILSRTLKKMGSEPQVIIPDRTGTGYGLSDAAISSVPDGSLLITVDCGIRNLRETSLAHERGIDVIITDHHACPSELPDAEFILNPRMPGETYANKDLCGAGVALKLAQALLGSENAIEFVDLAAFATIADVMPLTGENRAIAALGLAKMNEDPSAGIAALMSIRRSPKTPVTSSVVAYEMVPVVNAAGRMLSATMAFQLLAAEKTAPGKRGIADVLAATLKNLNTRRKEVQFEVQSEAESVLEKLPEFPRFIILASKNWPTGVLGPVANRIAEKYRRPAVLLGWNGEAYVGSGRTVDGVNLYEALSSAEHLMDKFGGHALAAGLTVREENVAALAVEMEQYMENLEHDHVPAYRRLRAVEYDFEPSMPVDASTIETLAKLEPCGCCNPKPLVLFRNVSIGNVQPLRSSGMHTRFDILSNGERMRAVMFDMDASKTPPFGDVIGELQVSNFGQTRGQIETIVRALSSENREEAYLRKAVEALRRKTAPSDTTIFFRDKKRMGLIYSAFLDSAPNGDIVTLSQLYARSRARVHDLTREETAFAYAVFAELGLIEDVVDGRIKMVLNAKKTVLENSRIYKRCER